MSLVVLNKGLLGNQVTRSLAKLETPEIKLVDADSRVWFRVTELIPVAEKGRILNFVETMSCLLDQESTVVLTELQGDSRHRKRKTIKGTLFSHSWIVDHPTAASLSNPYARCTVGMTLKDYTMSVEAEV